MLKRQVALINSLNQYLCGGALIGTQWVLTAAHCAKDATEMKVMLGAHNVREDSEEGRVELVTRDFFTHPRYSQITLHNDLALVHLPEKVEFSSKTTFVKIVSHCPTCRHNQTCLPAWILRGF